MRIMHISDLHLGKKLGKHSLFDDQQYILNQIIERIQNRNIQVLLISGDIFDSTNMAQKVIKQYSDFIVNVLKLNCQVFAIAGNHDNWGMFELLKPLNQFSKYYIAGQLDKDGQMEHHVLEDQYGKVTFWLLPYYNWHDIKSHVTQPLETETDVLRYILEQQIFETDSRHILLMHDYIKGVEEVKLADEESVGMQDPIAYDALGNIFDYVALGHLHRPQKVARDTIRYSGAPLVYEFGETNTKKWTFVTLEEKGQCTIELEDVQPLREVKVLKGTLEDLLSQDSDDSYLRIELENEVHHPSDKLRTHYPNLLQIRPFNRLNDEELIYIDSRQTLHKKTLAELYEEFYKKKSTEELTDYQRQILQEVEQEVKNEAD